MLSPEMNNLYLSERDSAEDVSMSRLVAETLPLRNVELPNIPRIEFITPYLVTEASRQFSPFYKVDPPKPETFPIGLEDKLLGQPLTANREKAPEEVGIFFAEEGFKMLRVMKLLYGEDFAARALAITRSGALAPASSELGLQDRQIISHLESSLSALVRRLNTDIAPEAENFRLEIYKKLEGKSPDELLDLYRRHLKGAERLAFVPPKSDLPKKTVQEVIESLPPSRQTGWRFMRDVVRIFSNPSFRTFSSNTIY